MLVPRVLRLLLFLGLGWALSTSARAQPGTAPGLFGFSNARQKKARIPIQLQRNLLVVKARLNGTGPYNFLLDTGINTSIITSPALADSLGLRQGQKYRVVGAGGLETGLLAYQTDSVRVELTGVVAPHMTWLVLSDDALNLSGYIGVPIHGILGSELFRSFVVSLQLENNQMTVHDPATFRAPSGRQWDAVPLTLQKNKAYITTDVQLTDSLTLPLKLVLDTGASHALSIELESDPRLLAPARRLPTDLGRGLSGLVQGYLGRVPTLRLGRYRLRSVLTSYPNAADGQRRADVLRNGNIGYELLKRFWLIIDYPHQRMLLRPNSRFRDPFEHDMCGMELLATGPKYRRYLVLRVMPGSPADAAGLQVEDELLSINFLPAEGLTLTQLDRLLHSDDGRVLFMVLRRADGSLYTTSVRLQRQI